MAMPGKLGCDHLLVCVAVGSGRLDAGGCRWEGCVGGVELASVVRQLRTELNEALADAEGGPAAVPAAQVPGAGGADVDVIGAGYVTSDQLKLPGSAYRLAAASHRQLAADVFEVRLDGVDGNVQLAGDFSVAQQA